MDYKDDNLDELLTNIMVPWHLSGSGVVMAIAKDSGYDCSLWDSWSQRDTVLRLYSGECERKWRLAG